MSHKRPISERSIEKIGFQLIQGSESKFFSSILFNVCFMRINEIWVWRKSEKSVSVKSYENREQRNEERRDEEYRSRKWAIKSWEIFFQRQLRPRRLKNSRSKSKNKKIMKLSLLKNTILRKILHFLSQLWVNNKDLVNITGSRSLRGFITTKKMILHFVFFVF